MEFLCYKQIGDGVCEPHLWLLVVVGTAREGGAGTCLSRCKIRGKVPGDNFKFGGEAEQIPGTIRTTHTIDDLPDEVLAALAKMQLMEGTKK